ncbi:MAG: redoxin domain-containing protein [Sedimentibacter sp.]
MSTNINKNNINPIRSGCTTIGRIAPDFTALSSQGPITLSQYRGKWVVLFYEPGDYYPAATTEIIAFEQLRSEFEKRNVQLLGVTIDSNLADLDWLYDIYLKTGIKISYPLISDRNAEIARLYDLVNPDNIYETSVRDVFIIGPMQNIRAIMTYPLTSGLNIYELLRLIDSLQVSDQYKVITPSNWMLGDPVLTLPPHTLDELIARVDNQSEMNINCISWYTCYENLEG